MPKIKIFTAKNVQQYGFTAGEIDALNAEWELQASELGLEEHLPEYWQQAKRHMSEKLAGRVAGCPAEGENKQLDGAPVELPSLDVDLADFDIAGASEITAVDLSDEELEVEFLADELSGLESIPGDDLELEIIPEWQTVSLGEMAEESAAVEELELEEKEAAQELTLAAEEMAEEDKSAEEFAAVAEPEIEVEEAAPELTLAGEEMAVEGKQAEEPAIAAEPELEKEEAVPEPPVAVEEWIEEMAAGEKIVPVAEPELEPVDTAALPETAVEEAVRAAIAEEGPAPFAEQKKESFFGKIIARLKRMF
ncbi:MAG: hypothetical protein AB1545_03745 [Thermodesulfobacteriota bacterium]